LDCSEIVVKVACRWSNQSDIYAFFFDQKGLMAGLGLQGTKITRLEK